MSDTPENVLDLNAASTQPNFQKAVADALTAEIQKREMAFQKAWANVAAAINVQADAQIALTVARSTSSNVMPAAQAFRNAEAKTIEAVNAVVDLAVKLRTQEPQVQTRLYDKGIDPEGFGNDGSGRVKA